MGKNQILQGKSLEADEEQTLRPQVLDYFVGQKDIRESLDIYIKASIKRDEVLDHILLYGPPGLGKTTLAQIVANELGTDIKTISAPAIEKSSDLVAILSSLNEGDVLFIDEIHRLPRFIEEVLYSAMEDYVIDIVIGTGDESRVIRIDLPPFTLIGATTRFGDLTAPLRDRFGVIFRLNYYNNDELEEIVNRTAKVYNAKIDTNAAKELALRSRGTPRIANRIFRRVRDYAEIKGNGDITIDITNHALNKLGINNDGLDAADLRYLKALVINFKGGPVGINNIATMIAEEVMTVEDVYEPYLIQEGYIVRTARGRVATEKAYNALGLEYLKNKKGKGEIKLWYIYLFSSA